MSDRQANNPMKLILISVISAAVGWLLCYGAMKTAEQVAKPHIDRIEAMQ